MHQEVLDLHYGELLDPIARGAAAHLRGDLVQVLGRYAKLLCIIGYGSVLPVGSRLKHPDESRHDVGCPLRGFLTLEKCGVGIHGIEIEHAHTLLKSLSAIGFGRMLKAEEGILKVMLHDGKRLALQLEDRVHEEMQPAARPVTAARHTPDLLLGRKQKAVEPAVLRRFDAPHMARHSDHHAPRRKRMLMSGEMKTASPRSTKEVKYLLLHGTQSFLPLQRYEKK